MKRTFRRLFRDRHGYMLVFGAILMPLVIMVSMLAVDLGMRYLVGAEIAKAAVLAAESGEAKLPDPAQAEETARSVAWTMLGDLSGGAVASVDASASEESVSVSISASLRPIFASVFGHSMNQVSVRASRQAE